MPDGYMEVPGFGVFYIISGVTYTGSSSNAFHHCKRSRLFRFATKRFDAVEQKQDSASHIWKVRTPRDFVHNKEVSKPTKIRKRLDFYYYATSSTSPSMETSKRTGKVAK